MSYAHTQRGRLHWLLWPVALGCFLGAYIAPESEGPWLAVVLVATGVVMLFASLCFVTLTVRDVGEFLELRFGPLSFFRKRIPYAGLQTVRVRRSSLLDGFGIHWVPGRGWTWNLWGFDCVELMVEGKQLRVGTDDPQGLSSFLSERVTPKENS